MFPAEQRQIIHATYQRASQRNDEMMQVFFERLFELDPSLEPLFDGGTNRMRDKFLQTIGTLVASVELFDKAVPSIRQIGIRHLGYRVEPEHYAAVKSALLYSLAHVLNEDYTPEVEAAWEALYEIIARIAREAAYSDD